MIGALILFGIATSALVAAAAWGAERLAADRGWPLRSIWCGALIVAGTLVGVAPLRPPTPLPSSTAAPVSTARSAAGTIVLRFAGAVDRMPTHARDAFVLAWIAVSATMVALFVAVQLRYARLRRGWPPRWIGDSLVRVAPATGPAVMGLMHPEIVIPRWVLDRRAHEQSIIVRHEAEHLHARDPMTLALAWLLPALMPWNVAAWWMGSRLRLAVELDCDARVLRGGIPRADYGSLLVDVVAARSRSGFATAYLLSSHTRLGTRLRAMQSLRHRLRGPYAIAVLSLVVMALVVACKAELPVTSQGGRRAPASATDIATAETTTSDVLDSVAATTARARGARGRGSAAQRQQPGTRSQVRLAGSVSGPETTISKSDSGIVGVVDTLVAEVPAALVDDPTSGPAHIWLTVRTMARLDLSNFRGLLLVNGQPMTEAGWRAVDERSIGKIELIGASLAPKLYTDRSAANGAIIVTRR